MLLSEENTMTPETSTDRGRESSQDGESPASPFGTDLRRFVHEQLSMARKQLARPGSDRHDGVHEARKCLRRTRAALALGAKPWRRTVDASDRELRRICRGLSSVRDAQALLEALSRLEGDAEFTPDLCQRSMAAATQRRDDVLMLALRRDENFAARLHRIGRVDARLAALDWTVLNLGDARAALKRSEHRMRRAAQLAMEKPDHAAAWHTFRRRLRRLRQQVTLLGAIAPGIVRGIDSGDDQAVMLGELQDDSLLLARCASRSPFAGDDRGTLRRIARRRLARRLATTV